MIVLVDRLVSFSPVVDLLFQLFDVSSAWFSIGGAESCPDLRSRVGGREDWLNGSGYSAEEPAVDKLVLTFPQREGRVGGFPCFRRDSGWRDDRRAINMSGEIISIKQGVDLTIPHQEIGGGELCHICHVDIEQSRVGGDGYGLVSECLIFRHVRHRELQGRR